MSVMVEQSQRRYSKIQYAQRHYTTMRNRYCNRQENIKSRYFADDNREKI